MVILTERFLTRGNQTLAMLLLFEATTNVLNAFVQLIVKKLSKIIFSAVGESGLLTL